MKIIFRICFFLILTNVSSAFALSKSLNITNAGSLTSSLTAEEKATITDLTVSGNIDARDIRCMYSELTLLARLDLSEVKMHEYIGSEGTINGEVMTYLEDEMPIYSFSNKKGDGKESLISIVFPNSLTSIGSSAFSYCWNLSGILTLPDSLKIIGDGAFYYCKSLTGNLIIGDSVTYIGEGAFSHCTGFNGALTLGKSVTTIRPFAFCVTGFTRDLNIPNSVSYLGEYSFGSCYSFDGCLTIGDGLSSFDYGVFYSAGFKELILGKALTWINNQVFYNFINLKTIICPISIPPSLRYDTFYGVTATVYVPGVSVAAYRADMYWGQLSIMPINGTDTSYIFIKSGVGGEIIENDVALINGSFVSVKSGEIKTFNFSFLPGYEIDKVFFNSVDVTSQVRNNEYTTQSILENAYLNVTFKKSKYTLSIKSAENGSVDLLCDFGDTLIFKFTPSTGWRINSVFYNDADVTNSLVESYFTIPGIIGNARINVSFILNTGVSQTLINQVKIYSLDSDIWIEGVADGEDITLFTLNGQKLKSIKSKGVPITIPLEKSKIYLLKTKTNTYKVIL